MEARVFVASIAVLSGFAALFAATYVAAASVRRKSSALVAQGDSRTLRGLLAWRVRNGFSVLMPLSRLLLRLGRVRVFAGQLADLLARRGFAATPDTALSVLVAGVSALALVVGVLAGGVVSAVACAACAVCIAAVLVGSSAEKRREEVREAVPGALESMAACFGSGFTLLQTFRQVASETPGPLGETFAQSAHVLEMGGSAKQALRGLREGAHASELAFVAVALDVQHQSGGAMRQVLDAASDTVKGELALRRALRVQTAQAKLSARVVVAMPFVLVAAFSLASPDFLAPFFSSAAGYALLALAIIMQVAGVVLVRHALAVDGVA